MGVAGSIVVFMCAWWMVFFMVLPWGIHSQWEDGEVTDGTEPGAPVRTGLGRKALIATGGAFVVWLIAWTVVTYDLIPMERPTWGYGADQVDTDG